MKPYVPSFSRMPARMTEPAVGASTWASGSQVCTGHIGSFTAKEAGEARNSRVEALGRERHQLGDRGRVQGGDQVEHRRQHQDRAEQRVEEELVGRIDPVL